MAKDKKKKDEVTYEIEEEYGMISDDKVYARISWNGRDAKDEVRRVWYDSNGEMKLGKGIDLDEDEIKTLHKLMKESHKEEVDFDDIFKSTKGISERRAQGFRTENGFIVLHRKGDKR